MEQKHAHWGKSQNSLLNMQISIYDIKRTILLQSNPKTHLFKEFFSVDNLQNQHSLATGKCCPSEKVHIEEQI